MNKNDLVEALNKNTKDDRERKKGIRDFEVFDVREAKKVDKPKRYKANDFSKEELAYYKGTGEFHIGEKEYAEIDNCEEENNYEHITNRAYCDLAYKRPRQQPEDFRNNSEYMLYDATLFGAVTSIENGFGDQVL